MRHRLGWVELEAEGQVRLVSALARDRVMLTAVLESVNHYREWNTAAVETILPLTRRLLEKGRLELMSSGRERTQRVDAVVLRHSDWGEADRLIWLFTLESGKLRAIAKGVRKARSRKAGHLEPFTHVRLLLASARDMPIITQAEAQDIYLSLREDLVRVSYAAYVIELLDRFTYEEGENARSSACWWIH